MGMLDGIRVIDLTQALSGPYCTMLLGDLGADVIKVEPPDGGDMTRRMGPGMRGEDSVAFLAINRNKRSVTLDLKDPDDQARLHRLVADADVVVENFRPGVSERLGASYETLSAVNPRLVYASISGFGQTGPNAHRPGFDLVAQAMSGVMSVTGHPGQEPAKCGVPIGDVSAGIYCALGVASALVARERTGKGTRLETSLFEAALSFAVWETAEWWSTGSVPGPMGSAHRLTAPYQALRTQDGWIAIGASNDRTWTVLCRAIGREDLTADPRFVTNADRMRNRPELQAVLEKVLAVDTTEGWMRVFDAAGFPAAPILDVAQVLADEHTLARGMVQEYDHPVEGTVRTLGSAIKSGAWEGTRPRPAPLLGEHNAELLGGV